MKNNISFWVFVSHDPIQKYKGSVGIIGGGAIGEKQKDLQKDILSELCAIKGIVQPESTSFC